MKPENIVVSPGRMEPDSEKELFTSARQGSEKAFKALFDRQKQYVYSLCRRATLQPGDAEELTRQTFIRVFRNVASGVSESDFSASVRRATLSTIIAYLREKGSSPRDGVESKARNAPDAPISKSCAIC